MVLTCGARVCQMTRTKLEKYLGVLETLVYRPLEFEMILYEVDQEWSSLRRYLDFLISHGLVEKLPLGHKRIIYAITERGFRVLRALQGQECLEEHRHLIIVNEP